MGKDQESAKEMIRISGARSVPVITVGSEVIIGFDSARIDELYKKLETRNLRGKNSFPKHQFSH